jgi:hypothetical protein
VHHLFVFLLFPFPFPYIDLIFLLEIICLLAAVLEITLYNIIISGIIFYVLTLIGGSINSYAPIIIVNEPRDYVKQKLNRYFCAFIRTRLLWQKVTRYLATSCKSEGIKRRLMDSPKFWMNSLSQLFVKCLQLFLIARLCMM